jgi:hypothetical protein
MLRRVALVTEPHGVTSQKTPFFCGGIAERSAVPLEAFCSIRLRLLSSKLVVTWKGKSPSHTCRHQLLQKVWRLIDTFWRLYYSLVISFHNQENFEAWDRQLNVRSLVTNKCSRLRRLNSCLPDKNAYAKVKAGESPCRKHNMPLQDRWIFPGDWTLRDRGNNRYCTPLGRSV